MAEHHWRKLERDFRDLRPALGFTRLDVQWGDAGDNWRLAGVFERVACLRFEALARIAGRQLEQSNAPDAREIAAREPDALIRWYRALKDLSGLMTGVKYAYQLAERTGQREGLIYYGIIPDVTEASALLCLRFYETDQVGEKPMEDAQHITIHQTFGIIQTGPSSVATFNNVSPEQHVALVEALAATEEALRSVERPSLEHTQAAELVREAQAELSQSNPNMLRVRGMLFSIATTVQTLGSAAAAYQLLRAAAAAVGMQLP
jgi:hypothetical protein